uniref:TSA: Wollemia nobilis Ref_Wollemi_Transcript_12083_2495 transcribed RNA sequence n=1 Tax=Wollemia nobilis TaxID=56998 RepID=A0A0C9RUW1_9CONI
MEHQELGEGKENFLGFAPSGSSNPPSVNGNPSISRSGYKVTEGSAPGFDFSSEDILSSYEYNKKQNFSDGHYVAPSRLSNFPSDSYLNSSRSDRFRESRTAKPYANEQSQEDDNRYNEIVGTVERTMKKYADNLLKVLDGMSNRLMQLELVNERLERSVGEMRADMAEDHKENGERFRMLEDHVHEVHRTIQILRDKQEIAEAQTELAKLQLARKESSSNFQSPEDKTLTSSTLSEVKKEHAFQPQNVQAQLRSSNPAFPALPALPAPPQSSPSPSLPMPAREQCQSLLPQQQQPAQVSMVQQSPVTSFPLQQVAQLPQQPNVMLMQPYYPQQQGQIQPVPQAPQAGQVPHIQQQPPQPAVAAPPQVQNLPYGCQPQHIQNIPNQSSQHVQRPQIQQMPRLQSQPPPQTQMQPQPLSQQPHLPQQAQMRPNIYSGQTHGVPPEAFAYAPETGQHQTQAPYQGGPSSIPSEASMYNYGGPPQIIQPSSQGQVSIQSHRPQYPPSDSSNASSALVPPPVGHPMHGYSAYNSPPRPAPSPYGVPFSGAPQTTPFPGAYMRFPSAQQQYAHPSGNAVPNTSGGHLPSSHAFDDLVEQVATMGFSRDQVRVTIQQLTESGQPVDMNSVLDRLNNSPGPSQRGWYN